MNNVVLIGRMTKDAELRYTPNQVAVATFTLAVNRTFKSQNGEREADFINCVIWQKQAENLANWARKGAQIAIQGRIQTRNYENQQGQRVYVTEIVAEQFQLLEKRNDQNFSNAETSNNYSTSQSSTPDFSRDNSPFGNSKNMDINDDDLPF